ncbi:NAD-dependent epimerase/dehydratase family protein [bacterium]|nr:NAD-dependent epimerase/dehydratase family protein [bacterium]
MNTVLLLGKGYIGTALETYFKSKKISVESLSRSMLDYTDPVTFQGHLEANRGKYELIINCSGYTGAPNVDGCETNKKDCWFWNVIAPRSVVLSSNMFELPVVQINSGCIYTGYEKEFTEDDEPNFGLYSNDSSFYSKCKHACETIFQNCYAYSMRIRMPFDSTDHKKNYLNKIYKYNTLISEKNSLTSVEDFCEFMMKFLFFRRGILPGPINVINTGSITAAEIVEIMRKNGINNPNWKFVETDKLNTTAQRSNCVLSSDKLKGYNLQLPSVHESLERDISKLATFLR